MISTRSGVLVIDTVVSLTLRKWETVSGQFGGNLMATLASRVLPSGWVLAETADARTVNR
jgi:hypothetical protein